MVVMKAVQRGFRDKIENSTSLSGAFPVRISVEGNADYDFCCFGVDSSNKLSDDRYMVFFNQPSSPGGEITLSQSNGSADFMVNLSILPNNIDKLVFTVSIDGSGTMGDVRSLDLTVGSGASALNLNLAGGDFQKEKAVIAIEIYRKDVWRVAFVASGFDAGLSALLKHYGGEEIASEYTAPTSQPSESQSLKSQLSKVSLEKKLQQDAPRLVSLAKPIKIVLDKHKLNDVVARVGLVLDISGSMSGRYSNGTVQEIVNKIVPLAVQFDDDGELDLWYYGSHPQRMPSVNLKNYENAVPRDWKKLMASLGYENVEPLVMELVVEEYRGGPVPAYVIFITDGGVGSESQIKTLLITASKAPIFWQFVGVGGSGYGVLERLDSMSGRYVDNANFFALDDFKRVPDDELYERLLGEFPSWLREVKRLGMIE
jgi:stress response protein SCP2